jgi:effector-binding domain-containing protein
MSAIRLVTVQPGPIAVVRCRTTFAEVPRVFRATLDVVWAAVRSEQISKHGHNVAVYRRLGGDAVDFACGVQVAARFDGAGEVACSETPGGEAVRATHVGPYEKLGETYDAIVAWALGHGRRLAGVNWEIYGDWNDDPAKLETEVYMLVEPEAYAPA